MIWIIAIFSVLLMAADRRAVKRWGNSISPRRQRQILVVAWISDTLPFIYAGVTFVVFRDNPTEEVMASMWVFFAYMLLAAARLPLTLALLVSRQKGIIMAGGAVSVAVVGFFIHGMAVTRTDYEVKHIEICSDRLPASFDGYRIVQISDLHIGTMPDPQHEAERVVEICNGLDADMIAFCGDLINIRHSEIAPVAQTLSQLRSRDGVYSVTGNHDLGVYVRDTISLPIAENTRRVIAAEREMGWQVLDDSTTYIRRGADSISVTGISFARDWAEKRHSRNLSASGIVHAYAGVPHELFNVTLAHIPQIWDDIVTERYGDITLSGHVHSMQIKLPVGERGISPAALQYKRWSSLYAKHNRNLYINDGLGSVLFPMRLGARPEITVIELHPDAE